MLLPRPHVQVFVHAKTRNDLYKNMDLPEIQFFVHVKRRKYLDKNMDPTKIHVGKVIVFGYVGCLFRTAGKADLQVLISSTKMGPSHFILRQPHGFQSVLTGDQKRFTDFPFASKIFFSAATT